MSREHGTRGLGPGASWGIGVAALLVLGSFFVWHQWPFWPFDRRPPRSPAPQTISGNNMRGIISMMIAYQSDFGVSVPEALPMEDQIDPWTACRHSARLFVTLAAAYPEDLPEKIFRQPRVEPSTLTMPGLPDVFGYAFDWAATAPADANRIVLVERPPLRIPGAIVAVYADGHIGTIPCTELPPGSFDPARRTLGRDGKPVAIQVLTPDGDDIFERGDGGADDVWVR